jgi:hypothetical protein
MALCAHMTKISGDVTLCLVRLQNRLRSRSTFFFMLMTALLTILLFDGAQGQDVPQLSCGLYDRLAKRCGCNGSDDYFLSYGRKYCERFLHSTDWSAAGVKWRDNTLVCLQRSLRSALARTSRGACDCKKIRDIAWRTHTRCYTQPLASVCRLPLSDLRKIYGIIDASDLLAPSGISQIFTIAGICIQQRH